MLFAQIESHLVLAAEGEGAEKMEWADGLRKAALDVVKTMEAAKAWVVVAGVELVVEAAAAEVIHLILSDSLRVMFMSYL